MLKLLNPWVILIALVALASAAGFGYIKGKNDQKGIYAREAVKQQTLHEAIEAGIAKGVSKMKITNTYTRGRLETIVRENTVYLDCKHHPDALRLLNDILAGKASVAPGSSVVPAPDSVD